MNLSCFNAAYQIFSSRYGFKVGRIYAVTYAAEMIKVQVIMKFPNKFAIGKNMRARPGMSSWRKVPILTSLSCASPKPAWTKMWCKTRDRSIPIDVTPESLRCRNFFPILCPAFARTEMRPRPESFEADTATFTYSDNIGSRHAVSSSRCNGMVRDVAMCQTSLRPER